VFSVTGKRVQCQPDVTYAKETSTIVRVRIFNNSRLHRRGSSHGGRQRNAIMWVNHAGDRRGSMVMGRLKSFSMQLTFSIQPQQRRRRGMAGRQIGWQCLSFLISNPSETQQSEALILCNTQGILGRLKDSKTEFGH
jgi:hypothetical protein